MMGVYYSIMKNASVYDIERHFQLFHLLSFIVMLIVDIVHGNWEDINSIPQKL